MASYQYDGEGQRAVKNLQSGGTLYWPGPDGAPLAESDLAGNLTAEYVYFGGQRIARTDYTSGSATLKYYLTDRLGSTIGVVDATFANVLEDSDYYPYGREIPTVSSDSNHCKFTGKERDAETGYDYFGARYYGSNTGRWMSPDWANGASAVPYADFSDPQTLNLYAYVRNNPIANSDPIGHNIIADGLEQRDVWGASSGITSGDSARAAAVALNTSIAAGLEAAADAAAQQQQPQTLSPAGLRFIECHEAAGCQPNLTVYDASGKKGLGDWTVGYGHKVKAGEDFSKDITAEQAADLLRADVQTAVNAVNRALKSPTTFQSQFDAMVSLAYNIGGGAFAKSTLVTRWNSGGVVEQADLFTRWSRTGGAFSRGLYARREEEYTMFNTGRYP